VPRLETGVALADAAVKLHEELTAEREDGAQCDEEPAEPGEPPPRPKSDTSSLRASRPVSLAVVRNDRSGGSRRSRGKASDCHASTPGLTSSRTAENHYGGCAA